MFFSLLWPGARVGGPTPSPSAGRLRSPSARCALPPAASGQGQATAAATLSPERCRRCSASARSTTPRAAAERLKLGLAPRRHFGAFGDRILGHGDADPLLGEPSVTRTTARVPARTARRRRACPPATPPSRLRSPGSSCGARAVAELEHLARCELEDVAVAERGEGEQVVAGAEQRERERGACGGRPAEGDALQDRRVQLAERSDRLFPPAFAKPRRGEVRPPRAKPASSFSTRSRTRRSRRVRRRRPAGSRRHLRRRARRPRWDRGSGRTSTPRRARARSQSGPRRRRP